MIGPNKSHEIGTLEKNLRRAHLQAIQQPAGMSAGMIVAHKQNEREHAALPPEKRRVVLLAEERLDDWHQPPLTGAETAHHDEWCHQPERHGVAAARCCSQARVAVRACQPRGDADDERLGTGGARGGRREFVSRWMNL